MKQLSGAVCDLASEVVSVLRGGDHRAVAASAALGGGDSGMSDVGVAAVRVLGADVLLPGAFFGRRPEEVDLALVREAVRAYPPGADASVATVWSHWGMRQALHRLDGEAPVDGPGDRSSAGEPDAAWLGTLPWQQLTHQLSLLGALAVPGAAASSGVVRAAAERPVDLARGFVRAVRRRDWLQAAGAGRWLALLDTPLPDARPDTGPDSGPDARPVPESLGLDRGLEFVLHMGGGDPRVALHAHAAQLMRDGVGVGATAVGG